MGQQTAALPAKYSLTPVFVSKDILEHNHTYLFTYCWCLVYATRAELNSYNRDYVLQSLKYLLSVSLRKYLPTPDLWHLHRMERKRKEKEKEQQFKKKKVWWEYFNSELRNFECLWLHWWIFSSARGFAGHMAKYLLIEHLSLCLFSTLFFLM